MQRSTAVPSAAMKEVLVSRHVSLVCLSSLSEDGIIGRSIKKSVKNLRPKYTMRRYFASYRCRDVSRFHPRLYHPFQFTNMRLQMRSWQPQSWNNIIHVAERAFGNGCIYSFNGDRMVTLPTKSLLFEYLVPERVVHAVRSGSTSRVLIRT